jgi:glycerol-3-phosphate acyltransferase PlsX
MKGDFITIALDAMGGDFAPQNNIEGALGAIDEIEDLEILLVGREDILKKEIEVNTNNERIEIINATEVIEMDESPSRALRNKKDSSLMVCGNLVKEGRASAMVSAGNTGATVGVSLIRIGRMHGIRRPAIAQVFPTEKEPVVILDVGANDVVSPKNLMQFAVMGSIYYSYLFKEENPSVGLLSIGEEDTKGTDIVVDANRLLRNSPLNFSGNVEGGDILRGKVNVVVCDGFVGNIILKFAESIEGLVFNTLRNEIEESGLGPKMGAFFMKPVFRKFKKAWDYSEYGGAPLLGLNGLTLISHGGSTAKAFKNALIMSSRFVRENIGENIKQKIDELRS